VSAGSSATITDSTIKNTVDVWDEYGTALYATGEDAVIQASHVELYASGSSPGNLTGHYGAFAQDCAEITIDGGSGGDSTIEVVGTYGIGLAAFHNDSSVRAEDVTITTGGEYGFGAEAYVFRNSDHTANVSLQDSSI